MTATAKKVVEKVRGRHSRVGLVNVSSPKPFDDEELFDKTANARVVVTVVNHWVTSGIGRVVAQVPAKRRSLAQLVNVGLADVCTLGGSASYLGDCQGISEAHIGLTGNVLDGPQGFGSDTGRAHIF